MKPEKKCVIRVSRWLIMLFFIIGAALYFIGLDLIFLNRVTDENFSIDHPAWFFIASALSITIGTVLLIRQGFYLIRPPTLLSISKESVAIGTGWRYKPHHIPSRYLRSVRVFQAYQVMKITGLQSVIAGGIELTFTKSNKIPASLRQSAGLKYSDYRLRLFKTYMNRSPQKAVEEIKRFIR